MLRSRRFFNAPNKRELLLPYLLVAPALVVLLTLSIYPLLYSITISLQQQTTSAAWFGVWSTSNGSCPMVFSRPQWSIPLSMLLRR